MTNYGEAWKKAEEFVENEMGKSIPPKGSGMKHKTRVGRKKIKRTRAAKTARNRRHTQAYRKKVKATNYILANPTASLKDLAEHMGVGERQARNIMISLGDSKSEFIRKVIEVDEGLMAMTAMELSRRVQDEESISNMKVNELLNLAKFSTERRSTLGGDKTDEHGFAKVNELNDDELLALAGLED